MTTNPNETIEKSTKYPYIFERKDGFYYYDPAYDDDGPYPTVEIANEALIYYIKNIF